MMPLPDPTDTKEPFTETESSILLSISNEISAVRNKTELFPIIDRTLKKLFAYDEAVIRLLNDDLVTQTAYLHNFDGVFAKFPESKQIAGMKFPVNDGVFDSIMATGGVEVFELNYLMKLPASPLYISFWKNRGMQQLIGVPLKTGLETIGAFFFFVRKSGKIPKNRFGLLRAICTQIAIGVQNVIASEQLDRKDLEKTVLLELSNDLAFSKLKSDLVSVIDSKLRKLISFSHSAIGLLDHFQDRIEVLFTEPAINGLPRKQGVLSRDLIGITELRSILVVTNFPEIVNLEATANDDFPKDLLIAARAGRSREMVIVSLRGENGLIGFLALFVEDRGDFRNKDLSLIKGVASQLSSSAGNILAREDILRQEKEKTLLLSFSNHIATVRDINGLKFILKQFLKKLFGVKEYIITIKNTDDKTYSHFLHDLEVEEPEDEGFKTITGTRMPVKGSLTGAVLESEEPVTFEINSILKQKKYSLPSLSFWRAANAERILGIRLKVANEDIGILWVQPGKINDRLLRGISAQIAIALANAMANIEVQRQFNEIQQYKQRLLNENNYLQEEIETKYNHSEIIGLGTEMQNVYQLMSQVAFSNSSVLILGETGTGKELIARAIHNTSPRKDKLMVKVNCAALPVNLIESELFGHERGSFTGAIDQKIGKFELAHNGTLFLDEIGEMPVDLQVKFLRALQEREIERIGGKKTIKVNVRIVAATNRNLQKEVQEGRFRSDLFYRLNVFPIMMPPLRKRPEDIPLLVNHFIKKLSRSTGSRVETISQKALQDLMAYNWPGNIRELEHLIERSLLLTTGNMIKQVQLPATEKRLTVAPANEIVYKTIDENERDYIIAVLRKCNGKIFGTGGAAEILGIPPSTLNSKIRKLEIKKDQSFINETV